MVVGDWKSDGLHKDGNASFILEHWPSSEHYMDHEITMNVRGGSPMSLYCSFSSTPLHHYYYQVEILPLDVPTSTGSSSLSVGVVRPSEVKKGWGTKGMFYNGNLTNGSSALKVGYGPRLKVGDVVVVEYGYSEEDMKHRVKFHLNGTCLGTAFEIVQDSMHEKQSLPFVPCLNCQGQIHVRTQVQVERQDLYRILATTDDKSNVWEGDWNLVQAWKAPGSTNQQDEVTPVWPVETSQPDLSQQVVTLHMEPLPSDDTSKVCAMVVKVCNTMRVIKNISPATAYSGPTMMEYSLENPEGDSLSSVVAATKMMPPPHLFELEQHLSQALASDWKVLRVDTEGKAMQAESCDGIVLAQFQRLQIDQDKVACTSYH